MKTVNIKDNLAKYMCISDEYVCSFDSENVPLDCIRDAIIDICGQVLELASSEARTEVVQMSVAGSIRVVSKESILNVINKIL